MSWYVFMIGSPPERVIREHPAVVVEVVVGIDVVDVVVVAAKARRPDSVAPLPL